MKCYWFKLFPEPPFCYLILVRNLANEWKISAKVSKGVRNQNIQIVAIKIYITTVQALSLYYIVNEPNLVVPLLFFPFKFK